MAPNGKIRPKREENAIFAFVFSIRLLHFVDYFIICVR